MFQSKKMKRAKPKHILLFFSVVGFLCGANIMFSSFANEAPQSLHFELKTILIIVFGGVIGVVGARNTTCILCKGNISEKIAFVLLFIVCLLSTQDYYAPLSSAIVFSTVGFAVITGVLKGDFYGQDDSRCKSFLKEEKDKIE